jgi:hypothetical protein
VNFENHEVLAQVTSSPGYGRPYLTHDPQALPKDRALASLTGLVTLLHFMADDDVAECATRLLDPFEIGAMFGALKGMARAARIEVEQFQ